MVSDLPDLLAEEHSALTSGSQDRDEYLANTNKIYPISFNNPQ